MNTKSSVLILLAASILLAACDALAGGDRQGQVLRASGIVEAVELVVAPEFGGRIVEVYAVEGESVEAGAPLLRLDDGLFHAQRSQAEASFQTADASVGAAAANLASAEFAVEMAEAQVQTARLQYEMLLSSLRGEEAPLRAAGWTAEVPDQFELPVWYFTRSEAIEAAATTVDTARQALEIEKANFADLLESSSNADLAALERRLAQAQAAFLIAEALFEREVATSGREAIDDFVQELFDAAEAELEAAQLAYDESLSEQAGMQILEARARLAVNQARYHTALDNLNALLTGEDALALQGAQAMVEQAERGVEAARLDVARARAALAQAEAIHNEAQAAVDLIDAQIARLTVHAPAGGVVLVRSVEPGEILAPGSPALTLGQLDDLRVTVYISEDQYGKIGLGDPASVVSDSFAGQRFPAEVVRIADQAEFTPRNVQTQEDRSTTVFAIELSMDNPEGQLSPGMPVDVEFGE